MLKMLLYLHIAGGSIALLSMFIPLVAPKGGRTHRRAGWVFVSGMTTVAITALILSGTRYLFDARPAAREFGLFLFYVSILTGNAVSVGLRALRTRERTGAHTHPWDIGMSALLVLAAAAIAVHGIATSQPLFVAFSMIGIVTGIQGLYYWLKKPADKMHWWFRHMSAMLGACIGATTAFLVVNASNLGLPRTSLVVWLTPSVVGTIATAAWTTYYKRKFSGLRRGSTGISPAAAPADPYMPART